MQEVKQMDLHFRQFDGTTFGMDSRNAAALRSLKKHAYYGTVIQRGYAIAVRRPRVPAKYVAAVMGEAAWLVKERYMKTVRWGDGPDHYIIYDERE